MDLKKLPFYPEAFLNHKRYLEARREFYEKEYVGKTVEFTCDIVGISGSILHEKGDRAQISSVETVGAETFKIIKKGKPVYGLFKPSCFKVLF